MSILHRLSGVFLTLLLPFAIFLLGRSLSSPEGYMATIDFLSSTGGKIITLLAAAALIHHFLAGLRHLLLDLHLGISKSGARISSVIVLVSGALLILITGIWLW